MKHKREEMKLKSYEDPVLLEKQEKIKRQQKFEEMLQERERLEQLAEIERQRAGPESY